MPSAEPEEAASKEELAATYAAPSEEAVHVPAAPGTLTINMKTKPTTPETTRAAGAAKNFKPMADFDD